MKIRDAVFLVIGGLLVISGMVLNSFLVGDADAQGGLNNATFRNVFCENLVITKDGDPNKMMAIFGINPEKTNQASLAMFGGKSPHQTVVYLGEMRNTDGYMVLQLNTESETDKRQAIMGIDGNGGRFESHNKMGENVNRLGVGADGGGVLDLRDKYGYKR